MRFQFGKNWQNYLERIDERKLSVAINSLQEYLGCQSLREKTFLDAGCGSGLFSLAARKLGGHVFSFDYDEYSVACAQSLKNKFFPNDQKWNIQQGDILSDAYINQLGKFDIVYCWGVLHHTGNMYKAFENIQMTVKPNGRLYIAIYNDQGKASLRWKWIKKLYNQGSRILKAILIGYTFLRQWSLTCIRDFFRSLNPFKTWREYAKERGMSPWHDIIDWVGGYPFEVAKPEEVFEYFHTKGFELNKLKTRNGIGCNEFVFQNKNHG